MQDPWYKASFSFRPLGAELLLQVPHDVFSTQRIDEGTLLLLDHLPKSHPHRVLDMGCGYGALGLPIAAKFPHAKIEMVDRDLLAVKWSAKNADRNKLLNVDAYGSLGFRDVKDGSFDWILCNVPARIGRPFIQDLIETGNQKLTENGELRIVVIHDLAPLLMELKAGMNWPLEKVASGPRHHVFAMKRSPPAQTNSNELSLYLRDEISFAGIQVFRPYDIGGDDQKRLSTSLPILTDALPRQVFDAGKKILCIRSGYGILPLVCKKRWPNARIVAVDRDLLGTTFTRLNLEKSVRGTESIEVREAPELLDAFKPDEKFDLILGEISPSAGIGVALAELTSLANALTEKGEAIVLCLEKIEKDWLKKFSDQRPFTVERILSRENFSAVRIRR